MVLKLVLFQARVFRHCGGDILLARPKRMEKRSAHKEGVARSGGIFLLIAEFDIFYLIFLPLSYRQILGDTKWSVVAP